MALLYVCVCVVKSFDGQIFRHIHGVCETKMGGKKSTRYFLGGLTQINLELNLADFLKIFERDLRRSGLWSHFFIPHLGLQGTVYHSGRDFYWVHDFKRIRACSFQSSKKDPRSLRLWICNEVFFNALQVDMNDTSFYCRKRFRKNNDEIEHKRAKSCI